MNILTNILAVFLVLFAFWNPSVLAADMGTLSCGETSSGEITVAGQKDTWTFSGSAGDRIVIDAEATGSLSPYVSLFPPDGGSILTGASERVEYQLSQSGIHSIEVSGNSTGSYNITLLNLTACSGTSISCGETLSGSLDVTSEMDVYVGISMTQREWPK